MTHYIDFHSHTTLSDGAYRPAQLCRMAQEAGIRDKVKIMIGGAPVSEDYCKKIGADCYTVDAASAADAAVEFCK